LKDFAKIAGISCDCWGFFPNTRILFFVPLPLQVVTAGYRQQWSEVQCPRALCNRPLGAGREKNTVANRAKPEQETAPGLGPTTSYGWLGPEGKIMLSRRLWEALSLFGE